MNEQLKTDLIRWVKNPTEKLSDELKNAVWSYFQECGANNADDPEDRSERRKILAKGIVIKCLYALDKSEAYILEKELILLCTPYTELIEENATLRRQIQALETELSESEEEKSVLQSEVWELQKELNQKSNGEGD